MGKKAAPRKKGQVKRKPGGVPSELTAAREAKAWELKQQHWSNSRIAAELKVNPSTITRILDRLEKQYRAETAADVEAVKSRQIAQLERIAAEAFEGWIRSQRDAVTTKETADGVEVTRKGQAGTAEFLKTVMQAMADVRKILGLDAKGDEPPAPPAVPPIVAEAAIAAALAKQAELEKGQP